MKIIFWMSNGFYSHFTSEHLLKAIIKALAREGHKVHILQMDQGDHNAVLPADLKFPNITTSSVSYSAPEKSNFVKRYISEIRWHLSCRTELNKHRDYDALFLQSTTVGGFAIGLARRVLGKKAIISFNVQDVFPYNAAYSGKIKKNSLLFKLLASNQRYGYKNSDHIITISEDMKDTIVMSGVASEKVEIVYNWSYQDELYENIDKSQVSHMLTPSFFNVVYAGNLGIMQNVDVLIETAKLMMNKNDVWFHIIGDGLHKEKLKERAMEYKIENISFWPMQSSELAPAIYSSADVNVIPLAKEIYRTAFPSKTAVCFACQRPIIFAIGKESQFGRTIMQETGCIVVDSDNPKELAEAIMRIKNGFVQCKTKNFYLEKMNSTLNSHKYAEIIVRR